jgi:ABC-2 type transport system ATP-binding protein
MEPRYATQRSEELLETVGLFERRHDKVETYSRGMKQRLHIARGLLTDPEVVFMDEPTIGLDPQVAQEVRAIIPQLRERGKTVLLTTHYMFEADVLCDQLALIDKGRIVAEGSPSEMKRRISRLSVIEMQLRSLPPSLIAGIEAVKGVSNVAATQDGMLHRIIVQTEPDAGARERITALVDDAIVESVLEREPTLEEAYLRILA